MAIFTAKPDTKVNEQSKTTLHGARLTVLNTYAYVLISYFLVDKLKEFPTAFELTYRSVHSFNLDLII